MNDMIKIKNLLKELQYYLSIPKTGKTTLLKSGIDGYSRYHWVVVPTLKYADNIIDKNNKLQRPVSLNNLEKMQGTHQAMIIDQEANLQVVTMALDEIDRLEREINRRTETSHQVVDLTELYQSDLHRIQTHIMEGLQIPWWDVLETRKHKRETILLAEFILKQRHRYDEHFKKIKSTLNIEKQKK